MMKLLRRRRHAVAGESLSADALLRPSADVLTARCDGAAVLLDLRREEYLSLDDTGGAIWSAIESGRTLLGIVEDLTRSYDADAEVIERDVRAFISDLLSRRLVVCT